MARSRGAGITPKSRCLTNGSAPIVLGQYVVDSPSDHIMDAQGYGPKLETVGGTPGLLAKMWKNPGKLQNFIAWSFVSFSPVSFQEISPGEGLGRVSEHLRQRLQEKSPRPSASFSQASSGSSLRSLSRASPRLPPGSSCLAGLWGNRGRSPYIMCRSLSRIFMQIFHSFSSRAVGALFVATSLRHFASFPFLQE